MFLGKTLSSPSASLHPGVEMGAGEFSGKPHEMLGGNLAIGEYPVQGRVVILLVASLPVFVS